MFWTIVGALTFFFIGIPLIISLITKKWFWKLIGFGVLAFGILIAVVTYNTQPRLPKVATQLTYPSALPAISTSPNVSILYEESMESAAQAGRLGKQYDAETQSPPTPICDSNNACTCKAGYYYNHSSGRCDMIVCGKNAYLDSTDNNCHCYQGGYTPNGADCVLQPYRTQLIGQ